MAQVHMQEHSHKRAFLSRMLHLMLNWAVKLSFVSFFHSVTVVDKCFLLMLYSIPLLMYCNMSFSTNVTTHSRLCELPQDCTFQGYPL